MNRDDELVLRRWLEARDPGPARVELREAVQAVPYSERPARFPTLTLTLRSGFGIGPIVRPLLLLVIVVAALIAIAGALVLQPWRPFPPRGLLAYTASIAAQGSTGIWLAAADGSEIRQVSPMQANLIDHSPSWSRDGRTLLFARTMGLDPLASCGGVGSVVLYDVATHTERIVATGLRPMNVIDWSPNGDKAAYTYPPPGCGTQVELGVVDLRTGQVTTTIVVPQVSELDPSDVLWHVEWTGDQASAAPNSVVSSTNGRDRTTTIDVRSHDGGATIRSQATSPDQIPTLTATNAAGAAPVELGPGGVPAWSPDDSAIVYIQPGPNAGPTDVEHTRDRLVIATAGTWQERVLTEIMMPIGIPAGALPTVAWTSDGGAVYWNDPSGFRVLDVVTGRSAGVAALPPDCTAVWQPTP